MYWIGFFAFKEDPKCDLCYFWNNDSRIPKESATVHQWEQEKERRQYEKEHERGMQINCTLWMITDILTTFIFVRFWVVIRFAVKRIRCSFIRLLSQMWTVLWRYNEEIYRAKNYHQNKTKCAFIIIFLTLSPIIRFSHFPILSLPQLTTNWYIFLAILSFNLSEYHLTNDDGKTNV